MKTDPTMFVDADIENTNIPVDNPYQKTSFISKPIGAEYKILRKRFGKNINVEWYGYNGYFAKCSVEWYVNEMLEKKTCMTQYFGKLVKLLPGTLYDAQKDGRYVKRVSKWLVKKTSCWKSLSFSR